MVDVSDRALEPTTEPTPIDSPALLELMQSIYTDPIDGVMDVRLEKNGDILAIAYDDIKILAFKFTNGEGMVRIVNPDDIDDDDTPQPQPPALVNRFRMLSDIVNKPTTYHDFE